MTDKLRDVAQMVVNQHTAFKTNDDNQLLNSLDALKLANEGWTQQCRYLEKQLEVQKYAADNYRRLLDEGDRAYAEMELRYQVVLRVALDALSDLNNGLVVHEGNWRTRQHVAISKIKEVLK